MCCTMTYIVNCSTVPCVVLCLVLLCLTASLTGAMCYVITLVHCDVRCDARDTQHLMSQSCKVHVCVRRHALQTRHYNNFLMEDSWLMMVYVPLVSWLGTMMPNLLLLLAGKLCT